MCVSEKETDAPAKADQVWPHMPTPAREAGRWWGLRRVHVASPEREEELNWTER